MMGELDDILAMVRQLRHERLCAFDQPDECKMSHEAYDALRASPQVRDVATTPTGLPPTIFGMKVVIDESLAPGEWKLVSPRDREKPPVATYRAPPTP